MPSCRAAHHPSPTNDSAPSRSAWISRDQAFSCAFQVPVDARNSERPTYYFPLANNSYRVDSHAGFVGDPCEGTIPLQFLPPRNVIAFASPRIWTRGFLSRATDLRSASRKNFDEIHPRVNSCSHVSQLVAATSGRLGEQVKREMHQSIVEIGTKICGNVDELRVEMTARAAS